MEDILEVAPLLSKCHDYPTVIIAQLSSSPKYHYCPTITSAQLSSSPTIIIAQIPSSPKGSSIKYVRTEEGGGVLANAYANILVNE